MSKPTIYICPKCGYRIFHNRKIHTEKCDGIGPKRVRDLMTPKIGSKEHSENVSRASKKNWENDKYRNNIISKIKDYKESLTKEQRDEFSKKMSESLKGKTGGFRIGGGRGKKGWYKGYWCDSSWELAYVIYCLDHNIFIKRNKEGFEYVFEGITHKYYPDFILEDESYVEIKGWFDKKNIEKIRQFSKTLTVLEKKDMKIYLDYAIETYGIDFIRLYK